MTDIRSGQEEGLEEVDFKTQFVSPLEQRALGGSLPAGDPLVPPRVEELKRNGDAQAIIAARQARERRRMIVGTLLSLDGKEQIKLHREGFVTFLELAPLHEDGSIDPYLTVGLLDRTTGKEVTDPSLLQRLRTNPSRDEFDVDTKTQAAQHRVILRPKIPQLSHQRG